MAANGCDDLDDLTLVVTTYDRPSHLAHLLGYLAVRGQRGRVLVVDASEESIQEMNRAAIRSVHDRLRVEHLSLPHTTSLADTYRLAIHGVETEYLCYCPDDDFMHPAFVDAAVRFLRESPDYALCSGRFCIAAGAPDEVQFLIQSNASVEHDDPLERLLFLIGNYWPTLRSVQRTDAAIDAATCLDAYMHDTVLGEMLHGSIIALHGKIKVLDTVSQVQVEHPLRHQERDTAKGYLFCRESFWRALRICQAAVCARLGTAPNPTLLAALSTSIFDHLAGQYWLWRDTAKANAMAAFAHVGEPEIIELCRWMERAVASDLLPEALHARAETSDSPSYQRIFRTLHLTSFLRVAVDGGIRVDIRSDMAALGRATIASSEERWRRLRDREARSLEAEQRQLVEALFAPDFPEAFEGFKRAHMGALVRAVGGDVEAWRAESLFDALFAIVLLGHMGRFGHHRFDLALGIAETLQDGMRGDVEIENLRAVARAIVAREETVE